MAPVAVRKATKPDARAVAHVRLVPAAASAPGTAWEKARKRATAATQRKIEATTRSVRFPGGAQPAPEAPASNTTPTIAGRSRRLVVSLSAATARVQTPRAAAIHARRAG